MLDAAAAAVAAAVVVVAGCCWCRCGASRGGNVHAIIRRGKNERKKVEGWMRWTYPSSAFRSSFISLLPLSLVPSFASNHDALSSLEPPSSLIFRRRAGENVGSRVAP